MIRWALTSSPRGFVVSSIVRITSICPLPKMLPDHALGREAELRTERRILAADRGEDRSLVDLVDCDGHFLGVREAAVAGDDLEAVGARLGEVRRPAEVTTRAADARAGGHGADLATGAAGAGRQRVGDRVCRYIGVCGRGGEAELDTLVDRLVTDRS